MEVDLKKIPKETAENTSISLVSEAVIINN